MPLHMRRILGPLSYRAQKNGVPARTFSGVPAQAELAWGKDERSLRLSVPALRGREVKRLPRGRGEEEQTQRLSLRPNAFGVWSEGK